MKQYTQAELAAFLGVQPPAISKWLTANIDKIPDIEGHVNCNPATGRRKFDIQGILAIVNYRKDSISPLLQQELDLIHDERKTSEIQVKYGITTLDDALTFISKLDETNQALKFENAQLKTANEILKEQNEYIISTQANFLQDNKQMMSKLLYWLKHADVTSPSEKDKINLSQQMR